MLQSYRRRAMPVTSHICEAIIFLHFDNLLKSLFVCWSGVIHQMWSRFCRCLVSVRSVFVTKTLSIDSVIHFFKTNNIYIYKIILKNTSTKTHVLFTFGKNMSLTFRSIFGNLFYITRMQSCFVTVCSIFMTEQAKNSKIESLAQQVIKK